MDLDFVEGFSETFFKSLIVSFILLSIFLSGSLFAFTFCSLIIPNIPPTATSFPASTLILSSIPALGAETSRVILSVSISTSGSSIWKLSPSFFNHFATVASVIDSPKVGTFISILVY